MRSESHRFQAYRGTEPPRFANRIELECARILDWYAIPWEYEPTSFVLERDTEGRVTRAFRPDFFLSTACRCSKRAALAALPPDARFVRRSESAESIR